MSFSSDVKEEVARVELPDNCKKAQLSAILQLLASIGITSDGLNLTMNISNGIIAKRIAQDLNYLYGIRTEIAVSKQTKLEKRNVYTLKANEKVRDILNDLDLWIERGLLDHPRLMFLNNDDMIKAYIAGCFLASGSVNSPTSTSYHLEIRANSEKHGDFLIKLFEKFYITAKMTVRREHYIVYVKAAEQISDVLRAMQANNAIMEFEDVRISRDYYNSLKRLENVTIANEQKIQAVADKQVLTVKYLKDNDLLKLLSKADKEIAELRLEHPEVSLSELASLYLAKSGTVLSKSGIRHRFEKITALAEKYQSKEID